MQEIESCEISIKNNVVPGYPRKVGGITVNNPIWLAPLAGITFGSLRKFYKDLGAGLVHTEMVSAVGLCHRGRKTKELLYGDESEHPVVLQLFGPKAEEIIKGAEVALSIRKFDGIEINMACPMPKVTKKGSGSKLMENPAEAAAMMKILKPLGLPVWSKVRIMPEWNDIDTVRFCEILFEAGADFIFVHGRTPAQRYEGRASRDAVEAIASRFPGMIGGSGDCYEPYDFADYIGRGCSAVLAGRGILRDVFIIPKTLKAMGGDIPDMFTEPDSELQSRLLRELGRNICKAECESLALMIARRMLAALFKGFPGAAQLRRRGAMARTWQEMEELLINWKDVPSMPELELTKENFPRGVIGEKGPCF